jgi:hypothetical protein
VPEHEQLLDGRVHRAPLRWRSLDVLGDSITNDPQRDNLGFGAVARAASVSHVRVVREDVFYLVDVDED